MRSPLLLAIGGLVCEIVACSGGGSGDPGGGTPVPTPTAPLFGSLSQLNALWTIGGGVTYLCNGQSQKQSITGGLVHIFNGNFSEVIPLSAPGNTCGGLSLSLEGTVDAQGNLSPTAYSNGGSTHYDEILTGSCTAAACQAATTACVPASSDGNLSFSLTNVGGNPFDGNWNATINCSNTTSGAMVFPVTIDSGALASVTGSHLGRYCSSTGVGTASSVLSTTSFNGSISSQAVFGASLSQAMGGDLTFAVPADSSGSFVAGVDTITSPGSFGTHLKLARSTTTSGS